jgi:hypothetical protein
VLLLLHGAGFLLLLLFDVSRFITTLLLIVMRLLRLLRYLLRKIRVRGILGKIRVGLNGLGRLDGLHVLGLRLNFLVAPQQSARLDALTHTRHSRADETRHDNVTTSCMCVPAALEGREDDGATGRGCR